MTIFGIIIGVVVATALGMVWFGPMFGRFWMDTIKPGEKCTSSRLQMWQIYGINLILTILNVSVINFILKEGIELKYAFLVWAGFSLPLYATDILWEGKSFKLFLIKLGYGLVSFAFVSQILYLIM